MWLPAPPRFRRWLGWQAATQALRSASGQSSMGSDPTVAFCDDSMWCRVDITVAPSGIFRELDVVTDDLAERLVRLRRFEAAVEVDRGLDIVVAKQAPHALVFAGAVLEIECRRGMAELMDGDPQARCLLDALGDLGAE